MTITYNVKKLNNNKISTVIYINNTTKPQVYKK